MASRSYASKLLFLLRTLCKYIRRYQPALENFIETEGGLIALNAVITACEALEDILEPLLPVVD